jgi:plasmid stability protein
MIQSAAQTNRVPKLIMLNEVVKKELTLQAVHFGMSLQAYIEQILMQAAERAEEQMLLKLAEEGDQEIIVGDEKQEFEKYLQSLAQ